MTDDAINNPGELERQALQAEMHLLEKGKYDCTIVEIEEPKESKNKKGTFFLPIRIRIGSGVYRASVIGYLNTIIMIYTAREYWIGRQYPVRVQTIKAGGAVYNDFWIMWGDHHG